MGATIRGAGWANAGLVCIAAWAMCGCNTYSQHRLALEERDAQIRSLRAERARLKEELRARNHQADSLETALAEANVRLLEPVVRLPESESFPELDEAGVGYEQRDGDLVLTLPAQITFPSGGSELSSEGRAALDTVAETLQRLYPAATYWVEGHTDDEPIARSGFADNRALALSRAQAVLGYLVETARLPDERFVVAGWGEHRPVASNATPEGKALNRRVEIVVRRPD